MTDLETVVVGGAVMVGVMVVMPAVVAVVSTKVLMWALSRYE